MASDSLWGFRWPWIFSLYLPSARITGLYSWVSAVLRFGAGLCAWPGRQALHWLNDSLNSWMTLRWVIILDDVGGHNLITQGIRSTRGREKSFRTVALERWGSESWRMKKTCWPCRERSTGALECGPFSESGNGRWHPASMSMGTSLTQPQQLDSSNLRHRRGHSFALGGYREAVFCRNDFSHVHGGIYFGISPMELWCDMLMLLSSLDSC